MQRRNSQSPPGDVSPGRPHRWNCFPATAYLPCAHRKHRCFHLHAPSWAWEVLSSHRPFHLGFCELSQELAFDAVAGPCSSQLKPGKLAPEVPFCGKCLESG